MGKRFFTLLLALCMLLSLMPTVAAADGQDYTYIVLSDSDRIRVRGIPKGKANVVIPESIDGKTVEEVVLDDDGYNTLVRITLPKTVKRFDVGNHYYRGCENRWENLNYITVAADNPYLKDIDGVLFTKDGSTLIYYPQGRAGSYRIPESVMELSESAFCRCRKITSVSIPASIRELTGVTFEECCALKAFKVDNGNACFKAVDGVLFSADGGRLVCYPGGKGGDYTVPNTVRTIARYAFYRCEGMGDITVPEGVTTLETGCFDCSFHSLALPASLTLLEPNAITTPTGVYFAGSLDQWDALHWKIADASGTHLAGYSVICALGGTSIYNTETKEIAPVVHENKRESKNQNPDYRLSKDAVITYQKNNYQTDENGTVKAFDYQGGSITVEKEGYSKRVIAQNCLMTSPNVYLQKKSDYPVINAVWLDGCRDVLHESYALPLVQTQRHILAAEIDWGKSCAESVHLYQDGKTLSLMTPQTVLISDHFDLSKPLYIAATNTDGLTNVQKLKLKSGTPNTEIISGSTIDFGEKLSFTLPDSVPVVGGDKLSIGYFSEIPFACTVEDGKVYVAIGVQGVQDDDGGIKTYAKSVKSMKEKFGKLTSNAEKNSLFQNAIKTFAKDAKEVKAEFGVDASVKVLGFAEGYYDENGDLQWLDGGIIIGASLGVSYSAPFSIGPVPCFFEVSFGGDLEAQLNLIMSQNARKFTPSGTIRTEIALDVGIGAGVNKMLSASGGGTGKLKPTVNYENRKISSAEIRFSFNFYVKGTFAGFTYKHPFDPLIDKVMYRYPSAAVVMSTAEDEPYLASVYNLDNYEPEDLRYLADGSPFVANDARDNAVPMAYSDCTTEAFQNNTYEHSDAQIRDLGDGKRLAVWKGYDPSRSGVNALALFYSFFDGSMWSEPALIEADGTADGSFRLAMQGTTPVAAWQDMDGSVTDDAALADALSLYDISAARFDVGTGKFEDAVSVSGANGTLDMHPAIVVKNDAVSILWVNNAQNDCFQDNSANSILCRTLTGGEWGEVQTLYSGLQMIQSLAANYNDEGTLQTAWSMDTDGDSATTDDLEIYIDNKRFTENDVIDSAVCYQNGQLCAYSGGKLQKGTGWQRTNYGSLPSDSYQLVTGNAATAVLFTKSDGVNSRLCVIFNDQNGTSMPVELTDGSDYIESFSGCFTEQGELQVLVNRTKSEQDNFEDPYSTSRMQILTYRMHSHPEIVDVFYRNENYVPNEPVPVSVTLHNAGPAAIEQFRIDIDDADGNQIHSQDVKFMILSGETKTVATTLKFADPEQDKTLRVTVTPTDDGAYAPGTTETFVLHQDDIAVEHLTAARTDDDKTVVQADIVNRGYSICDNAVVNLRAGTADGEILASQKLGKLSTLELEHVVFEVQDDPHTAYFLTVEMDGGDDDSTTDHDFVVLVPETQENCEHDLETRTQDVTCTTAGYEAQVCCKCGETVSVLIEDAPGHEFMWVTDQKATETEPGRKHEVCTRCGATRSEDTVIPAGHLEHSYEPVVTPPTCTEQGYTTYLCGCGESYVDDYVDPMGHNWGEWSVDTEPTETEAGRKSCTCAVCGAKRTESIPALNHTHELTEVAKVDPTCTGDGAEACWKCGVCGRLFSDAQGEHEISAPGVIPATGHKTELRNVKAATCTAPGYSGDAVCTVCGEIVQKGSVIKATGHKWDAGQVTTEPTESAEGVKAFTCTICGAKRTESIPKLTPAPQPVSNPFADVAEGQYYYDPVLWAVNHDPQITNGTSATTFSPDATCTRGQVVTFLWRAKGCPNPKSNANPFSDVAADAYYYKAVLWAVEEGITNGTSTTTFSPDAGCTRGQVVTFLWRADGKPSRTGAANAFVDIQSGQYYYDAVLWAVEESITNGTSATTFSPDSTCTRGQIVTFLYRDMK